MAYTDEEQKRIFAKNLNYYITKSGKQQKEVAEELGFSYTTFNTWCKGKILPKAGKIQAIADYFRVLTTQLTDDHPYIEDEALDEFLKIVQKIVQTDKDFVNMVMDYYYMDDDKKKLFCNFYKTFISKIEEGRLTSPFFFPLQNILWQNGTTFSNYFHFLFHSCIR